jgi:NAD+ synthase
MNCEAVEEEIVNWLRGQLETSGLNGFVVGVSGGVDSATVSTLCAETGAPTHVLSLPIGCVSDGDRRAMNHLEWLEDKYDNVTTEGVHLDQASDSFLTVLENMDYDGIEDDGLVRANFQSRLRMCALYSVANREDVLVAGTGNKVEDEGVGFFTKFGDGGVDISPICDLVKTEVWELAEYLGVDEEIVDAQPTDGLWDDNRSDEDQLGMTYREMEKYMEWEEMGRDPENVSEADREKYEEYLELHRNSRHKMSMPPVCDLEGVK